MKNTQQKKFAKRATFTTRNNGLRKVASLAAASSVALVALGGAAAPMAQAASASKVTAAAPTASFTPCPYRGDHPVLQLGSTGRPVSHLQCLLQVMGYRYVAADGSFGPQTNKAVRAFQRAHRLQVDGVVGPQTWDALHSAVSKKLR